MFSKITPRLAVAGAYDPSPPGWVRLDVRGMIDGPGNASDLVEQYVKEGLRILSSPQDKLLVICDHGQSRSNLIAALIHARLEAIPLDAAVACIEKYHPGSQIKQSLLASLRTTHLPQDAPRIDRQFARVAITGGQGFLGKRLCKALGSAGFECQGLSRSQHSNYLSSSKALDAVIGDPRPDCIVHLAHPKPYNSEEALQGALTQLISVATYCEDYDVALLFPSSWTVFDGVGAEVVSSSTPVGPHTRYGRLKVTAEAYLRTAAQSSLNVRIVRLPALFGTDSLDPRFLRYFADCINSEKEIVYHEFSNGPARVPLVHVDDCVNGFVTVLQTFNATPLLTHLNIDIACPSVKEIAESVAEGSKSTLRATPVDRDAFVGYFQPDVTVDAQRSTPTGIRDFVLQLGQANR